METSVEKFTVVCAWCNRILSTGKEREKGSRNTHSICENCFERMRIEIERLHAERSKRVPKKLAS